MEQNPENWKINFDLGDFSFGTTMFDENFIEISDEDIIQVLADMDTEMENDNDDAEKTIVPPPSTTTTGESTGRPTGNTKPKRRFAQLSEEELDKLEGDRHEKKTIDSTAWAVRLIKGNFANITNKKAVQSPSKNINPNR